MDIVVAIALLLVAAIVMTDSLRLGVRLAREPKVRPPDISPSISALLLAVASVVNLVRAWSDRRRATRTFVTRSAIRRVLAVLLPFAGYVVALGFIGIYVALNALHRAVHVVFRAVFAAEASPSAWRSPRPCS